MSQQAFSKSNGPAETWVISRTEEGFRVYSPSDPTKSFIVGGGPDDPTCTCPDFQHHEGDPRWRCKHILAVLGMPQEDEPDLAEERQAVQNEGQIPGPMLAAPVREPSQMVLKRSVSPDGRIDSLSVEFSCAVDSVPAADIKAKAQRTLALQAEIVESFLRANGKSNGQRAVESNGGNSPAAAHMLAIGGINTKWGRRLYINVQSNGQTLKFFGSRKQLADILVTIGYPQMAERIDEGIQLNVPCRVVTKPSEDGKYLNIETVLPPEVRPQRSWQ